MNLGAKLPGPKPLPLVGNALMFIGKPERMFRKLAILNKKYKRMLALWMGPKLTVLIFNAKDAEAILKAKGTFKAEEYQFLRPWLGESILISEGAKFKHNKKLLTPAFHSQNLKQYLKVFSEYSNKLIDELEEQVDEPEFDIQPYLSLSTMFALLETSMGVKKETLGNQTMDYIHAVERLGRFAHERSYKVWLRPDIVFKYSKLKQEQDKYLNVVHPLTEKVIKERRREYLMNKENVNGEQIKWPVFLDKFFEATDDETGAGLTDDEIKDEVMTMLFAGHDTTSVAIGFCLCMLGLHQNVQEKLQSELDYVFNGMNEEVTYEDCKKLVYMDQVIQETWRLFPPIPMIGKKPQEDIPLEDCTLPSGCTTLLCIMAIHRDETQYKNANDFNPDNFLPENIKQRNPYSFIPFSAGQRTCVGQRYAHLLIKVTLTYILRRYQVSSERPISQYKLAGQTSLKMKNGFMISLKDRQLNNNNITNDY